LHPARSSDNRYRIVGPPWPWWHGRGLSRRRSALGQPVALKFLPEALGRDPVRLAQFHNEVRTARQVSHRTSAASTTSARSTAPVPHDGVRRRRGPVVAAAAHRPLPEDKALEIARQICAGSPPRTNAACSIAI
jgi:serine/threonine-protein kinase